MLVEGFGGKFDNFYVALVVISAWLLFPAN